MKKNILVSAAVILVIYFGVVFSVNASSPTLTLSTLSPDTSNKIALAAFEECAKRGYNVTVAVVGRDGNLSSFIRDPLSGTHTIDISQKKAYASATFKTSTANMQERQEHYFTPGVSLIIGGVPISIGGIFYGGVGVAGANPPSVDEECAKAGIEAVAELIEFGE